MLLPAIVGTAGAAAVGSMNGMFQRAGNVNATGYWIIVNAVNRLGQPLLIVSIALIVYGMKHFGRWPLAIATVGAVLLYVGMFVFNMSVSMIAFAAALLVIAYGIAYAPFLA
jgi:hypothetical protein